MTPILVQQHDTRKPSSPSPKKNPARAPPGSLVPWRAEARCTAWNWGAEMSARESYTGKGLNLVTRKTNNWVGEASVGSAPRRDCTFLREGGRVPDASGAPIRGQPHRMQLIQLGTAPVPHCHGALNRTNHISDCVPWAVAAC